MDFSSNKPKSPPKSLTAYYLAYFGDRQSQIMEIIPLAGPGDHPHKHVEFGSVEHLSSLPPEQDELVSFTHPCFCNPELIYCDDVRGNEVWEHKLEQ